MIEKHRAEIMPLRKIIIHCQTYHNPLIEEVKEWKEKYQKEKQKNDTLEKEVDKLQRQIEQLTKTNERYRVAIFDKGNFKSPDKQDGEKKTKGGQKGHGNTNKDHERNYETFKRERIYSKACGRCGNDISRASGIKEKVLLDIEINTKMFARIIESERQWCGNCHKEVQTMHLQSLPFTEYGMNTFMVVMYLSVKGKASLRTITAILNTMFGLPITKSGVGNILTTAKEYLQDKYEELKQAIRDGDIMYNDETGWSVRGKSAWMWIMTTPDKKDVTGKVTKAGITIYVAAESRGKGIFKEMYGNSSATSMHDGYTGYESITGADKSLYCWAHVLRFSYEETIKLAEGHRAIQIRDRLVDMYQTIRQHSEYAKEEKEKLLRAELDALLAIASVDETVKAIQHRIGTQKEGLIRALLLTEDGTNNLGEREFRELAIKRNISYGSDTYGGMETTAIVASIVRTITRDKTKPFFPTVQSYLREGIQKKDSRYKHVASSDT
ncbi:MAG: IS66 family transposase [Thermoplasmataceae archaeon]